MEYIALLRGINVGNSVKINMKELKQLFEMNGLLNVSTYINSGNVLFETIEKRDSLQDKLENVVSHKVGSKIKILIKTKSEIIKIANCIPSSWENNTDQKTDVAYLFQSIDSNRIINELPFVKEYIQIIYVKGALIWNVQRTNYNKSHLNKIISNKLYQEMTVRNVNTARYLAGK